MISLVALPLLFLMQVMPPPLGHITMVLVLGRAFGTGERELPVPPPRLQSAPAEDCDCGVPSSPRGPR